MPIIIILNKMLARNLIKRMNGEEKNLIRDGGIYLSMLMGGFAYLNYREYIKKDFLRSEGHYRFNSMIKNITPWN